MHLTYLSAFQRSLQTTLQRPWKTAPNLPIIFLCLLSNLSYAPSTQAQAANRCENISSPVVQSNVLFNSYTDSSGGTPCQGHVLATRVYDPVDTGRTEKAELWDAGAVLNQMAPKDRNILMPQLTLTAVNGLTIAVGDGNTQTFTGTLKHPILPGTVKITDQQENFFHNQSGKLNGTSSGRGCINRLTGAFQITFNKPPGQGIPIQCSYTHYAATSPALEIFNTGNVDNILLGLDVSHTGPQGYVHDLDGNGVVDESDGDFLVQWKRGYGDGKNTKKVWLLGPAGKSTPALGTPPGRPHGYYGTDITKAEQDSLDVFIDIHKDRRTLLYAGSGDSMLHAFDAGQFAWGDNPETLTLENRGYFKWMDLRSDLALETWWQGLLGRYSTPPPQFRWQVTKNRDKAPDYGSGAEMWAFIPVGLVSRLKDNLLTPGNQTGIDGSPVIADVYFSNAWHTLLICTEGTNSDGIFCLDVTNPNQPLFLWEYADPDLIRPRFMAAVPQIGLIALGGTKRWVVFLPSGENMAPNTYPSIYLIDISDGSLVDRVFLQSGMDRDKDNMDDAQGSVPTSRPTITDSDGNGYVDRLYVATDKGFVFKVNIPDDPTTPDFSIGTCLINTDFSYVDQNGFLQTLPSSQQFKPIFASPTAVVDNNYDKNGKTVYNVRLFFGTGDPPSAAMNSNQTHYFFSYSDKVAKGMCNPMSVNLDSFMALDPGHGVLASASGGAGIVYFGTVTPNPNDSGKLYALDMANGSILFEKDVGDIRSSPLVEDEHLYIFDPASHGKIPMLLGGGPYNNDAVKSPDARAGIGAWKEMW